MSNSNRYAAVTTTTSDGENRDLRTPENVADAVAAVTEKRVQVAAIMYYYYYYMIPIGIIIYTYAQTVVPRIVATLNRSINLYIILLYYTGKDAR